MAFNVQDFKSQLEFGGARPSLFQVICNFPNGTEANVDAVQKLAFLGRSSSIPESEIGVISLPYFGRSVKFAGDRTFASWGITIINDEDFAVREALEEWHNLLNDRIENVRDGNFVNPNGLGSYKQDVVVQQYSQSGDVIREYTLIGAFPVSIERIPLDWASTNRVQEFNAVFAYDYWDVERLGP